jgi:hypothetical protein
MRYAEISRKEQKCQDLTSLTVKEFDNLLPVFEDEFQKYMKIHRLDGKDRFGRKYVTYANCPLPTAADRLLFILIYIKTNNLQVIRRRTVWDVTREGESMDTYIVACPASCS